AEIERVLGTHPAVGECAVVRVPDAKWGETPLAFIVPRAGTDAGADDLVDWCRSDLAGYKKPSRFEFVDALPRNAAGKVDKAALRAPFWAGRSRAIGGAAR
ncbi:MAG: hypothetical protein LC792_13320, partial [Actinobacteria bacterium]|nr:hypothetical protein [Actinomycetota bacterium]